MDILTDFPERLRAHKTIYVGDEHTPLRITHARRQPATMLLNFEGYNDSDTVGELRNKIVYVKADHLPQLPEGEYYHHELLGLHVLDESGVDLGFLTEILETGANDVYVVVSPEGDETLLPAIASVVIGVDLDKREMHVRAPEWL